MRGAGGRTGGDVLGGREAVAAADEAPQAVRLYHCNFGAAPVRPPAGAAWRQAPRACPLHAACLTSMAARVAAQGSVDRHAPCRADTPWPRLWPSRRRLRPGPPAAPRADFYYMDAYSLPRFGPGAFLLLLQTLFARATGGRELQVLRHGKPNPPAYVCAAHKLQRQLGRPGAALRHIYAVGCVPGVRTQWCWHGGGPDRGGLRLGCSVSQWAGRAASAERGTCRGRASAVDTLARARAERGAGTTRPATCAAQTRRGGPGAACWCAQACSTAPATMRARPRPAAGKFWLACCSAPGVRTMPCVPCRAVTQSAAPGDPAHYVADDVRQAVGVIMAAEAERALQAPQGASHACVTSAGH